MATHESGTPAPFPETDLQFSQLLPAASAGVRELLQEIEAKPTRLQSNEVQTKFRITGNIEDIVEKPGVEFIARSYQHDLYLLTPGEQGEQVRCRRQGDKITLGYKGVRIEDAGVRVRPKYEIEIDEKTEQELMKKYGFGAKEVNKIRDLYQFGSVVICADWVVVRRGEEVIPAGQFIELRTTNTDNGEALIRDAAQVLGLDYEERINASYFDIQLGKKDYTFFPESMTEISPLELYEIMATSFTLPRNEAYFSSPLTSGGAKRLFEGMNDLAEQIPAIIRLNSQVAEIIAHESEDLVVAYRVTLPHLVGHRQGWGEMDYLKFWIYYLSGIPVNKAKRFEQMIETGQPGIDINVFNDHNASRTERAMQYEKLVDGFVSFVKEQGVSLNPVNTVLCLPDYRLSLGCSSEVRLANALGIPLQEVIIDKDHPGFRKRIAPIAKWLQEEAENSPSNFPNSLNYVVMFKNPN